MRNTKTKTMNDLEVLTALIVTEVIMAAITIVIVLIYFFKKTK